MTSQWGGPGLNTGFESRDEELRKVRWVKLLGSGNSGPGATILRLGSPQSAQSAINSVLTKLDKEEGMVKRSVDLDERLELPSHPSEAHPPSDPLRGPVDSTLPAQPESLDPLPKVDIVIL